MYKYGTTNEIKRYFKKTKTYKENENEYYDEFDLMTPLFFEEYEKGSVAEKGCQYLLYLSDEEEVLGVLKWKRYGIPNHQLVEEKEEKESYVAIRFIDVKKSKRENGIALEMIKYWSKNYLKENDLVVGGKATPKGKSVKIHEWIEREIKQKYYINEMTLINEWEEENESW